MSTSSSNLIRHKNLSIEILLELNKIFEEFSAFQAKVDLPCPSGCGKCCFKADIYCTPIELLPMALALVERGEGEATYDKCIQHSADHCLFMEIADKKSGMGMCSEYLHRPLVCRTFGVAGRHDKNGLINFSVCTTLKEVYPLRYEALLNAKLSDSEVAFIDDSKSRLLNIDPAFLEKEFPINEALAIMLEKVLFLSELDSDLNDSNPRNS